MAIRREDEHRDRRPDEPEAAQAEPRAGERERVRVDVLAIGRRVIAEDRALLQRLADYDRGNDAGH